MFRFFVSALLVTVSINAVFAQDTSAGSGVECGPGSSCPEEKPCCSQYGKCGVGAYCLGGCDPLNSYSLDSCVPAPTCKSDDFKFPDLDDVTPNTKYLGDASKSNWVSSGSPLTYDDNLLLTMAPDSVGTLLASNHYMWYGKVSAKLKTSRGAGVVTAFILLSDVKDEIDFEFVGVDLETAQTNFYFQGITNYNNGKNATVSSSTFEEWHTYEIDWKPESITWSIDGTEVRTLEKSSTFNSTSDQYDYPQTPARVQLSLWPAGLPTNGKGTIEWGGGLVDWDSTDIKNNGYYYAQFQSVSIECYDPPAGVKKSGSNSYVYTGDEGTSDTVSITDKETVLKSLLGTGTNMSADYPSASKSDGAASTSDVATVPGLEGAGPGTNGQRGESGGTDSGESGSGSATSSGSGTASTGFVQGTGSNGDNNSAAPGQNEKVMQGSFFAVLVAFVGLLVL